MDPDPSALLTEAEHLAMDMTADLFNHMVKNVIGNDKDARPQDCRELTGYIHDIQRMIMSQAAGRAYPERYRLLGERVRQPIDWDKALEQVEKIQNLGGGIVGVFFEDGTLIDSRIHIKDHHRIPSFRADDQCGHIDEQTGRSCYNVPGHGPLYPHLYRIES